jgi:hypothetical protein
MGADACAEIEAFCSLVRSINPRKRNPPQTSRFVNRMEVAPQQEFSSLEPRRRALTSVERALVGKFARLWPSPKTMESWVAEHQSTKVNGQVLSLSAGRGYFVSIFSAKKRRI